MSERDDDADEQAETLRMLQSALPHRFQAEPLNIREAEERAQDMRQRQDDYFIQLLAIDFLAIAALYREAVEALADGTHGCRTAVDPEHAYCHWRIPYPRAAAVLAKARTAGGKSK